MSLQATKGTGIEVALRSELHRRGLRFRLHRRILPGTSREIDIVLPASRVAVSVFGCWWHGCPEHFSQPKRNAEWWAAKIASNVARDADTARRLVELDWTPIEVWEHESPVAAADRVVDGVRSSRAVRVRAPR